jgi:hypothetical protein
VGGISAGTRHSRRHSHSHSSKWHQQDSRSGSVGSSRQHLRPALQPLPLLLSPLQPAQHGLQQQLGLTTWLVH